MSSRVGIQQFISPTEPTGTQVGDEWFNSATNVLYKRSLVNGQLSWLVLGTSNTTGTAGQVIGITSAGTPGFITGSTAGTVNTAGSLYGATPSCAIYQNLALGYQAGWPTASAVVYGSIAIGYQSLNSTATGCHNIAVGYQALCRMTTGYGNIGIGLRALANHCQAVHNTAIGMYAMANANGCGNENVAIGYKANCYGRGNCNVSIGSCSLANGYYGNFNVGVGYFTLKSNTNGGHNVAIGNTAMQAANGACCSTVVGSCAGYTISNGANNILIGYCSGAAITTGCGNVIIGSCIGTTTLSDTFIVQTNQGATACVRLQVDNNGLQINGAAFTGGGGGGSGQFNTSISNQIGYSVTDKLFDPTGTTGALTNTSYIVVGTTATTGVAAVMPSTTGTRYVVHSIHITNTAASDAEITGRIDHTQGYGGTATSLGSLIDHVSFFASRLPVPSGSAVELMKKPQVLNPNDWIRLQATTPQGGTGVNGALTAFIVYESSTDWAYTGNGYNLPSTSPTTVYTSAMNTTTNTVTATSYPSVLESVRVTNYSNIADYRVTVSWTNSLGIVQSYLAYNMLVPAFATVELLEKPKRITAGDLIRATPEAPNVLSIQVSGKLITSTYV